MNKNKNSPPTILKFETFWNKVFPTKTEVPWKEARRLLLKEFSDLSYHALRGFKKIGVSNELLFKEKLQKIFEAKFSQFYDHPVYPHEPIENSIPTLNWIGILLAHPSFIPTDEVPNFNNNLKEGEYFVRISKSYTIALEYLNNQKRGTLGIQLFENKLQLSLSEKANYLDELINSHPSLKELKPVDRSMFLDYGEEKLFNLIQSDGNNEEQSLKYFHFFVTKKGIESEEQAGDQAARKKIYKQLDSELNRPTLKQNKSLEKYKSELNLSNEELIYEGPTGYVVIADSSELDKNTKVAIKIAKDEYSNKILTEYSVHRFLYFLYAKTMSDFYFV